MVDIAHNDEGWDLNTYLITDDQANLATVEDFGVKAKRLIGDDENRCGYPSAMLTHEPGQLLIYLILWTRVDGNWMNTSTQPLANLLLPILEYNGACYIESL